MVFNWLEKAARKIEQRNENRIREQKHINFLVEVLKSKIVEWNDIEISMIIERIDEMDFQKFTEIYSKEKSPLITISTDFFWEMAVLGLDSGYHRKDNEMEVRKLQSKLFEMLSTFGLHDGTVYSEYIAASNRIFKKAYRLGRESQM